MQTLTLIETPTPPRHTRLSFRWWEVSRSRICPCGKHLQVSDYEPSRQSLKEDGSWDTSCSCGRIITIYDMLFTQRPLPRGPAPTQLQREMGLTEEDLL